MDTIRSVAYSTFPGISSVAPWHEAGSTSGPVGGIDASAEAGSVAGISGRETGIGPEYQQKLSEKEEINQTAREARQVAEGRKLVDRARKELELVVKSFPPFPPGSAEREQYLRSVAGIRTIIDQLTIAPESRERLENILGQGPMINADLPAQTLAEGMTTLDQAGAILADIGAGLVKTINDKLPQMGSEGDFAGRSHDIGVALAGQQSGITREPPTVLRMFA